MKRYIAKPKAVRARKCLIAELVDCYNGIREAKRGDYVVQDEVSGRVYVMRETKFENKYKEDKSVNRREREERISSKANSRGHYTERIGESYAKEISKIYGGETRE